MLALTYNLENLGMALDISTESVTLAVKERTWRIEIFTDLGADPLLRAHREKVWLRPDGSPAQREILDPVERRLSQIAAHSFGGITGAQLAGAVADAADALRLEDIAALTPQAV
jgi:hypothetical protein